MCRLSFVMIITISVLSTSAIADEKPIETDKYGGNLAIKTMATGFFRIQQISGRWLFITPNGHGYIALGANHVGKYLDFQADEMGLLRRFQGDRKQAANFLISEMDAMGLNAGEAYAPLSPELQRVRPWVANIRFPAKSKFEFDVFDEKFQTRLHTSIVKQCREFRTDPMVLGIAFADLPVWDQRRIRYFESLPANSPGRKQLATFRLAGQSDDAFLAHVADTLYRRMKSACREAAPNHLFFGERFRLRGAPDDVIRAVGKHVDVFCTQALILSPQRPPEWQVFQAEGYEHEYKLVGKPMVVIDWAAPFSLKNTYATPRGELRNEKKASEDAAKWLTDSMKLPFMIGVFKCQLIGLHGNDRWFEGKARRTYLKDDGRHFDARTAITKRAHLQALKIAYSAAKSEPSP